MGPCLTRDMLSITIDGRTVLFFMRNGTEWAWSAYDLSDSIRDAAIKTAELLNLHHKSPAVQMWLSSGQYGGMTLEEFLEAAQWIDSTTT